MGRKLSYGYFKQQTGKIAQNTWTSQTKGNLKRDLVWFGLVWFYGISTTVGYLILSPVYTYILDIYDL